MNLPVFDRIQEALERYNKLRKKALDRLKIDEVKKRRVKLKVEQTKDSLRRQLWSKKHGKDNSDDDLDTNTEGAREGRRGDLSIKESARIAGQKHTKVEGTRTVLTTELLLLRTAPQVTFLHRVQILTKTLKQDLILVVRCCQISCVF